MSDNTPFTSQGQVSLPNDGQVLSNTDPGTGVTAPPTPPTPPPAPTPAPQAPVSQPAQAQPVLAQKAPTPGIGNPQPFPAPDYSNHPAVKQAGLVSTIARTLAGSPTTVSIDANGNAQRTPATLTGKQIALAIALQALSGAAAGAGAKPGPGVLGRAAEAGFAQGEQRQQQNQQQAEQSAQQDYARRAQTLETNMKMHNNALMVGMQDKASNDSYVSAYHDLATKLQDEFPSYIKGYATYADLAKYNVTKENAIPYQVTPRMDANGEQVKDASGKPLWDINYMIVDPSVTSSDLFTKEDVATAQKYHLGNAFNNPNLGTSPMRIGMALNYKTQIHSLEMMDDELGRYYDTLNANLPKGAEKLTPPAIGAATGVDSSLAPALTKFQSALVRTQGNYTRALQTLADPKGSNDPSAAGKVAALLGGTANIQRYDALSAPPRVPTSVAQAESIKADPNAKPEELKSADALIEQNRKDQIALAGGKARADAQAKAAVAASVASSTDVPTLGEALAQGVLTEDQIPGFSKLKPEIQAYLAQHHPNLAQGSLQITGEERKRRDLATNAMNNLGIIQSTLQRRPDLLGVIEGRVSQGKELTGTNDADLAAVNEALDNYALASTGAHGIRSVEARTEAKRALLNSFKNGPAGVNSSINTAKSSLQEFANIGKPRGLDGSLYVYKTTPTGTNPSNGATPQFQYTTKDGKQGWNGTAWVPTGK